MARSLDHLRPRRCPRVGPPIACTLLAVALAAGASAQNEPRSTVEPVRPVVLAGDTPSRERPAIWRAVLDRRLAGRPVCVLALAGERPAEALRAAVAAFERYGGERIAVPVKLRAGDVRRASSRGLATRLGECGGFWFVGGQPSRIVDTLRPGGADTLAARAIRRAHDRGAVVGGSFAAVAALSDPMIAGGNGADALVHGAVHAAGDPGVWIRPGMGLVLGVLIDPHDPVRLLVALGGTPAVRAGYVVDEDTALVLEAAGATVSGTGSVVVVRREDGSAPGHARATAWWMADGDRLDPRTGEVRFGSDKTPVLPVGPAPAPPAAPRLSASWRRWIEALARSEADSARFAIGPATLVVAKGPAFRVVTDGAGRTFSAGPFRLEWMTTVASWRVPHGSRGGDMSSPADLTSIARRLLERRPNRGLDLPSQVTVHDFVEETLGLLFPHFRRQPLSKEAEVTAAIWRSRSLLEAALAPVSAQLPAPVSEIAERFYSALPDVLERLCLDAEAIFRGDPAAESVDEVVLAYPGFYAIAVHRVAHVFYGLDVPLFPRIVAEYAHARSGIDIHPGAKIGDSFCIDHGSGVVIGETAVLGNHVKVYQGVTLGALSVDKAMQDVKRHPTIEDHVVIYANATILGGDTVIGHDSIIGGNVWLTTSVPPHTRVYHKSDIHVASGSNFEI